MKASITKLHRYQRIKARKFRSKSISIDHYLTLYWRYWHKVYIKHVPLWDIINEGINWNKGKRR